MGRRLAGAVVAATLLGVLLTTTAAWAGPPAPQTGDGPFDNPEQDLTLGAALDGEIPGVSAQAVGEFGMESSMQVQVHVTNTTGAPVDLAVPAGTILETQVESEQSVVVVPPEYEQVSVTPGESDIALTAYCAQEFDMGPWGPTDLSYAGMARDPLPQVLENIAAKDPPEYAAQDAIWWVTDSPYAPLDDPQLASLLDGVDTAAFAESPTQVVPDPDYTPGWAGGGSAGVAAFDSATTGPDGRSLLTGAALAVFALVAVVGLGLWFGLRRSGRPHAATVAPERSPGWYPDPSGAPFRRFWDGRKWTNHTTDR
jgi:hypothetical protein